MKILVFVFALFIALSCGRKNSSKQSPTENIEELTSLEIDMCPSGATDLSDRTANLVSGTLTFTHQTNNPIESAETRTQFDSTIKTKCADADESFPNWVRTCADPLDEFSQGVGNFVTLAGCVFRVNQDLDRKQIRVQRIIPRNSIECQNLASSNYDPREHMTRKPCFVNGIIQKLDERIYQYE